LDDGFVIEKSFPLTSSDIPDLENIETIVEIQNEDETVEVAVNIDSFASYRPPYFSIEYQRKFYLDFRKTKLPQVI